MKIAYFDCFSGVSGDMIIGALLDAGLNQGALEKELMKLGLPKIKVAKKRVIRSSLAGTRFIFSCNGKRSCFESILKKSRLKDDVKEKSRAILKKLYAIERNIHGGSSQLHELGEIDTLIDIVGSISGLKLLGIEEVYVSRLPWSYGFVNSHHGKLPLPAPAAAKLMEGTKVDFADIEGELVTPTGIGILKVLAKSFGSAPPSMEIERLGYGAGSRSLKDRPSLLRFVLGEKIKNTNKHE